MSNEIKSFAGGGGANVITQVAYEANTALRANGFVSGEAQSDEINKVLRQATYVAAGIATFIDGKGINVVDDGDIAGLATDIENAIKQVPANNALAVPFSGVTSKPTTLSGYGITNAIATSGNQSITGTLSLNTAAQGTVQMYAYSGNLTTTAGDSLEVIRAACNDTNNDSLRVKFVRDANGADWTTASVGISRVVDVSITNEIRFSFGGITNIYGSGGLIAAFTPTSVNASVPVVLPGNPTTALQAAPKQYVDLNLAKAGGTMTGPVVLSGDATAALNPVSKQQFDAVNAGKVTIGAVPNIGCIGIIHIQKSNNQPVQNLNVGDSISHNGAFETTVSFLAVPKIVGGSIADGVTATGTYTVLGIVGLLSPSTLGAYILAVRTA